jgi:hypothetical protein
MKRLILISLLLSSFFLYHACGNIMCCDLPPDCCETPKELAISVINSNGDDLLNQSKIDGFKINDLRVFHFYNNQNHFDVNSNNPNRLSLNSKGALTEHLVSLKKL